MAAEKFWSSLFITSWSATLTPRKDLHANIVLHHSVRVIGKRISENSLHRLPCRPDNDDVASAGSCGMLGVPGLSCQAPKQVMPVGPASLHYRAVTEPHLAAFPNILLVVIII